MKRDYTIIALLLILGLAVLFNLPACYESNYTPPNSKVYTGSAINVHDYQIEIVEDSLFIFDCNRFVGSIPFNNVNTNQQMNALDSLIELDNE